jgi:hypothetical protein
VESIEPILGSNPKIPLSVFIKRLHLVVTKTFRFGKGTEVSVSETIQSTLLGSNPEVPISVLQKGRDIVMR